MEEAVATRRTRKVTFNLSEEALGELHAAVARGAAPSKSAFVERALTVELRAFRRAQRRRRWEEAMRDSLFLKDIAEVAEAFASADADPVQGSVGRP